MAQRCEGPQLRICCLGKGLELANRSTHVNQVRGPIANPNHSSALEDEELVAQQLWALLLTLTSALPLILPLTRCEDPQLLRWALSVLGSLAADDWSRQRQQKMLPRLLTLLAGTETDDVIAREAAVLAANLVTNANMLEAMHRLGGMVRLEEVAARSVEDPRLHSVNAASGAMEAFHRGHRAPLPGISPRQLSQPGEDVAATKVQAQVRGRNARAAMAPGGGEGAGPRISAAGILVGAPLTSEELHAKMIEGQREAERLRLEAQADLASGRIAISVDLDSMAAKMASGQMLSQREVQALHSAAEDDDSLLERLAARLT